MWPFGVQATACVLASVGWPLHIFLATHEQPRTTFLRHHLLCRDGTCPTPTETTGMQTNNISHYNWVYNLVDMDSAVRVSRRQRCQLS
jgi:hypothetical protein